MAINRIDLDRRNVYEAGDPAAAGDNRRVWKGAKGAAIRRRRKRGSGPYNVGQLVRGSSRTRWRYGGKVLQSVEALCGESSAIADQRVTRNLVSECLKKSIKKRFSFL